MLYIKFLEPTANPNIEPSASPNIEPSTSPIIEPSASPTIEPSASPTVEITATPAPVPPNINDDFNNWNLECQLLFVLIFVTILGIFINFFKKGGH